MGCNSSKEAVTRCTPLHLEALRTEQHDATALAHEQEPRACWAHGRAIARDRALTWALGRALQLLAQKGTDGEELPTSPEPKSCSLAAVGLCEPCHTALQCSPSHVGTGLVQPSSHGRVAAGGGRGSPHANIPGVWEQHTGMGSQPGAAAPHSNSNFQVYDLMKGTIRSETIRISASLSW